MVETHDFRPEQYEVLCGGKVIRIPSVKTMVRILVDCTIAIISNEVEPRLFAISKFCNNQEDVYKWADGNEDLYAVMPGGVYSTTGYLLKEKLPNAPVDDNTGIVVIQVWKRG